MNRLLHSINVFLYKDFIFSHRFRLWRHIIYWTFHVTLWAIFWMIMGSPTTFPQNLVNMTLWVPLFIFFTYPLVYIAVPHLLLKGKVWQFFLFILAWGGFGIYLNNAFQSYVYGPLKGTNGFQIIPQLAWQGHSYLCMTTSAAIPVLIKFFKLWTLKQRDWLWVQQEKVTAEVQLLKAQVHPHFLFNTLNNIYSFSLENSPKTAELILKLSSLLTYMLYNCTTDKVPLQKEVEVMKNYIALEKERYGNKIKISWTEEGTMENKYIVPLLLLPFLENAFKHGLSEQIQSPWLEIKISVRNNILTCKIANSKNENVQKSKHGIGISNVEKRLELLYPDKYELTIRDESDFFIVSMMLVLSNDATTTTSIYSSLNFSPNLKNETSLPAYR